jgi:hypothetical protein
MGHQIWAYADDINVVGENIDTIKKNMEALLDASKEVGLKLMLMSRCQKAGQKHSIKIANRSIEDVAKFKSLGTALTDQKCMREEIKSRLNSGNACYRSVHSLLSSPLLSGNVKVKIYKTIILPVVLYGCETWSVTLREEHRLRMFENRVLRRIFGPKRDEVTGEWRKLHIWETHNLYSSPDIIRQIKSRREGCAGHVARMGEVRKVYEVLVGKVEERRPLERPRHRWENGIRIDLREVGWESVERIHLARDRDLWRSYVNTIIGVCYCLENSVVNIIEGTGMLGKLRTL